LPDLLKALAHSNKDVRKNASETSAEIGSETAIAGLLKALEDSNKDVRGHSLRFWVILARKQPFKVTQGFRRL